MAGIKLHLTAWLLVCVALVAGVVHSEIDFNNPVRSAEDDLITDLPELTFKPNFKQYSGYLEADSEKPTNRFWHYWFVESQSDPDNDPLVLWLNGGPGCSSLLGLLTELGPFRVTDSGSIVQNPYAWNKRANVIFLESPAGVGFSYSVNGDTRADDDTTAEQNHLALKSFLRKFPKYKNNSLYLTGESYGGVYLPTLGVLVDLDADLNLKGIAIGNGYLDANKLAESLVYFSYYHGLVGRSTWEGLSKNCCDGREPARGNCPDILAHNRSVACSKNVFKATDEIINSGVNPYNLYDQCANPAGTRNLSLTSLLKKGPPNYASYRESVDKKLMLSPFNLASVGDKYSSKLVANSKRLHNRLTIGKPKLSESKLGLDPPCTDDSVVTDYLNRNDVLRALHIPEKLNTPFATCADNIEYEMIYPGLPEGLKPQIHQLMESERNLNLLVYNGDVDLMCNFFGDEWFVDDLGRKVVKDYAPWYTNQQVSGFSKYFDKITYFTVKGSGHMVPTDRPAEALNMFEQFLNGFN